MRGPRPPAVLEQAVCLALGDIDYRHRVTVLYFTEEEHGWSINYSSDGRSFGNFGVPLAPGEACETFRWVADQLQAHLGDDLDSDSYRPTCGIHDHPAEPTCVNGEARWCCPRSCDAWSAPIGSIGEPPVLEPNAEDDRRRVRFAVVWDE